MLLWYNYKVRRSVIGVAVSGFLVNFHPFTVTAFSLL